MSASGRATPVTVPAIPDQDTLATIDLCSRDERWGAGQGPLIRETGVRCGRPLVYPVAPGELPAILRRRADATGHRYYGALFAFDLDPLPRGRRYTAARFQIRLGDQRAVAVEIHGDGAALGLTAGVDTVQPASELAARALAASAARGPGWPERSLPAAMAPRAHVFGLQCQTFGWEYDDRKGQLALPTRYTMHAVIEAHPAMRGLHGSLEVSATITRTLLGVSADHVANGSGQFDEPFETVTRPSGGAVRLCMAADVKGYSGQPNPTQQQTQHRLVALLASVRQRCGIRESDVSLQPQGDGQFCVMPAGIDESIIVPGLVSGLAEGIREANRDLAESDRVRLRVALHRGHVEPADNGWVGNATVAVHRILDCAQVRDALAEDPNRDFVLVVADVIFRDVISHGYAGLPPGLFREILVEVPQKHFVEPAWLYAPG